MKGPAEALAAGEEDGVREGDLPGETKDDDISLADWAAAYAPSIQEFPATRFLIAGDGPLVRIAFGHNGAPMNAAMEPGSPVYVAAISMAPQMAAELRDILTKILLPPVSVTSDA